MNGQKIGQNNGWQGFTKKLQMFLERETENPLWDKILPGKVPSWRENFSDVQEYRNDVMHAHNIKRDEYLQMKRLFQNINDELDEAIESLADGALIPETYNEDLGNALTYLTDSNGVCITDEKGNPIIVNI